MLRSASAFTACWCISTLRQFVTTRHLLSASTRLSRQYAVPRNKVRICATLSSLNILLSKHSEKSGCVPVLRAMPSLQSSVTCVAWHVLCTSSHLLISLQEKMPPATLFQHIHRHGLSEIMHKITLSMTAVRITRHLQCRSSNDDCS